MVEIDIMKEFRLEIVTPDKTVYSDEVDSLIVPAHDGYLGVMANHAPLLCTIKTGIVFIKKEKTEELLCTGGGFLETANNKTTLLVDSCEKPGEIDLQRAQEALTRAKDRLKAPKPDLDVDRAQTALSRAMNRLKAAGKA